MRPSHYFHRLGKRNSRAALTFPTSKPSSDPSGWIAIIESMDPLALGFLAVLGALVAFLAMRAAWDRWSRRRNFRRRELEDDAWRDALGRQQAETERLASKILATSSTRDIPGFEITRQIEAVFTDGHPSLAKAVEGLKALAAEKGANAVIHLHTERNANGKCGANGDAVMVRPSRPAPPPPPPIPRERPRPPLDSGQRQG